MIEMKTSQECLERMEALVRRLAKTRYYSAGDQDEVAAIVRDLPQPVDPDEAVADEIHSEWLDNSDGTRAVIMKALKRGRALERGEGK